VGDITERDRQTKKTTGSEKERYKRGVQRKALRK